MSAGNDITHTGNAQSNVDVRELNDISHIQEFLFWKIELLQAIDDFVTF
jgi:hypothetical protein